MKLLLLFLMLTFPVCANAVDWQQVLESHPNLRNYSPEQIRDFVEKALERRRNFEDDSSVYKAEAFLKFYFKSGKLNMKPSTSISGASARPDWKQ